MTSTYLLFLLDQIKELPFFSVLKHNENVTARVNELKVLYDVRMVESSQHFYFPLNLLEDALHLYLPLVQYFDCHLMSSNLIHSHYTKEIEYVC